MNEEEGEAVDMASLFLHLTYLTYNVDKKVKKVKIDLCKEVLV